MCIRDRHYTIETLNNYLKNPFREEKAKAQESENEDDTEEYLSLIHISSGIIDGPAEKL